MKAAKILLLLLLFFPGVAAAHIEPGGYLQLQVEGKTIHGTWDITLYSLAETAGLQDKNDRELQDFAVNKISASAGSDSCALHIDEKKQVEEYRIPPTLYIEGECPHPIARLTIDYFPLLVIDPSYSGFVNVMAGGQSYTSALSTQKPYASFQIGTPDRWQQFKDYFREGVWHIWTGYDHILFLLSLLLSAAFILKRKEWQPRDGFGGIFWQTAKIVTAFTVAHSVTLGLVIFDMVSLPSRLVESTIALSIAVAAANNLRPVLHKRLWLLTFCFGLIHGMGFAGALKELGLPDDARWLALVAFNLGVEVGQLAIVCSVLPVIYGVRHSTIYRRLIFRIGSVLIIGMALIWFVQRTFGL